MARVVNTLVICGADVNSISTPGWKPTEESLGKAASYVASQKLSSEDRVIIDLWSNSAYMGTDEMGLPSKPVKDGLDGRYHILGQLQAAPKPMFQKLVHMARDLLSAAGEAKVTFVSPFPRYISSKCCSDPSHLTNFGSEELVAEMLRAEENASTAIGTLNNDRYSVFSLIETYGIDRDPLNMVTLSGLPLWAETDGVHLSDSAYEEIGNLLSATEAEQTPLSEKKRGRLESIVPGPPAKRRQGPAATPSPWVMGGTASSRGPPYRGRASGRGGWRGRGPRGPRGPRGRGVRGRGWSDPMMGRGRGRGW